MIRSHYGRVEMASENQPSSDVITNTNAPNKSQSTPETFTSSAIRLIGFVIAGFPSDVWRYARWCSVVHILVIREPRTLGRRNDGYHAWCYNPNPRRTSHAAGAHHDNGGDSKAIASIAYRNSVPVPLLSDIWPNVNQLAVTDHPHIALRVRLRAWKCTE